MTKKILAFDPIIGDLDPSAWGGNIPEDSTRVANMIKTVITSAYAIAGVACVGFLIYGGFKIIFATGDPQRFKEGTDTVMYSLIGLIIIVSTGLLFNFITNRLGLGDVVTILSLPYM
ncbi:hypothetical protein JW710_03885 [Candidatus Dojkabacteria bacterium]|nr:hypothetical protein [Candidatus Dojkabacteria bacterium]